MESTMQAFPRPIGRPTPPGLGVDNNMAAITKEYEVMKDAEKQRHKFVESLMVHIQTLTSQRDDALRRLQRTEFTCNAYQDKIILADSMIEKLQKSIDCDRFVLAVVDGDSALFHDEYIKDGAAGGERAAQKLHQAIFDYLMDKPYFQHDFKIVIKVFANLQGLLRPYLENKLIPSPAALYQFVQGFNKTNEHAEIVDAGNLKEAADTKVKAALTLFRRNLHCKHILLAASGDNSYAGFLRQFITADGASQQVTMIESLPFARDLAQLTSHFQTTKFDNVFRDTKIFTETRHTSVSTAREPLTETTGNAWANTAAKQPASLPVRTTKSPETRAAVPAKTAVAPPKPRKEIWVNAYDERIDSYIKHDPKIYNDLKKRKMCNKYWLLDACTGCNHDHSGTLSTAELDQLRLIARTCSCRSGLDCRDPDCVDGHRCLAGEKCTKGDSCWFTDDMHYVSMEGLKSIPVPVDTNSYVQVR